MAARDRPRAGDCGNLREAAKITGVRIIAIARIGGRDGSMTAIESVRRTPRVLGLGAAFQALGWGLAVSLGILAGLSFATLAYPDLARDSAWQLWAVAPAGV